MNELVTGWRGINKPQAVDTASDGVGPSTGPFLCHAAAPHSRGPSPVAGRLDHHAQACCARDLTVTRHGGIVEAWDVRSSTGVPSPTGRVADGIRVGLARDYVSTAWTEGALSVEPSPLALYEHSIALDGSQPCSSKTQGMSDG